MVKSLFVSVKSMTYAKHVQSFEQLKLNQITFIAIQTVICLSFKY